MVRKLKVLTKKFSLTPKGKERLDSFIDSLPPHHLISDVYSSDFNKIIVTYYG